MKNTIIPSNLYIMFTDEAAKRCVRAGCSIDKAVDIIRVAEKELAKKGYLPRKNVRVGVAARASRVVGRFIC